MPKTKDSREKVEENISKILDEEINKLILERKTKTFKIRTRKGKTYKRDFFGAATTLPQRRTGDVDEKNFDDLVGSDIPSSEVGSPRSGAPSAKQSKQSDTSTSTDTVNQTTPKDPASGSADSAENIVPTKGAEETASGGTKGAEETASGGTKAAEETVSGGASVEDSTAAVNQSDSGWLDVPEGVEGSFPFYDPQNFMIFKTKDTPSMPDDFGTKSASDGLDATEFVPVNIKDGGPQKTQGIGDVGQEFPMPDDFGTKSASDGLGGPQGIGDVGQEFPMPDDFGTKSASDGLGGPGEQGVSLPDDFPGFSGDPSADADLVKAIADAGASRGVVEKAAADAVEKANDVVSGTIANPDPSVLSGFPDIFTTGIPDIFPTLSFGKIFTEIALPGLGIGALIMGGLVAADLLRRRSIIRRVVKKGAQSMVGFMKRFFGSLGIVRKARRWLNKPNKNQVFRRIRAFTTSQGNDLNDFYNEVIMAKNGGFEDFWRDWQRFLDGTQAQIKKIEEEYGDLTDDLNVRAVVDDVIENTNAMEISDEDLEREDRTSDSEGSTGSEDTVAITEPTNPRGGDGRSRTPQSAPPPRRQSSSSSGRPSTTSSTGSSSPPRRTEPEQSGRTQQSPDPGDLEIRRGVENPRRTRQSPSKRDDKKNKLKKKTLNEGSIKRFKQLAGISGSDNR